MEERVKVLPILEHVARVQVKFLVLEITSPHVRWRQVKIQVTLGQVPSPLAHSAPGSDVTTGDWGVLGLVVAQWIFAFRFFNTACVFVPGLMKTPQEVQFFTISVSKGAKGWRNLGLCFFIVLL